MVARSCNELIAVKITQSPVPEVARSLRILGVSTNRQRRQQTITRVCHSPYDYCICWQLHAADIFNGHWFARSEHSVRQPSRHRQG